LPIEFILGGNKLSDFGVFANWFFAAGFVGSMVRMGIHFAETATAPRNMAFPFMAFP
jgi:hypothetical protein